MHKPAIQTFSLLLALLLFSHLSCALDYSELGDKLNLVGDYGSQYDAGEISYPQLLVITRGIAHEVREDLLRATATESENAFRDGLPLEAMQALFGEPTSTTNWLWIRNEERAMRIQHDLPTWQKIFYDSDSIRIRATVLPQAVKEYGPTCPGADRNPIIAYYCKDYTLYYHYDFVFNLKPKTVPKPDLGQISSELEPAISDYVAGTDERVVDLAAKYDRQLWQYVEDNTISNDCTIAQDLIGGTPQVSEHYEFQTNLREFDNGKVILKVSWCESGCDHGGVSASITLETDQYYIPHGERMELDEDYYAYVTEEDLKLFIKTIFGDIKYAPVDDEFLRKVRNEYAPKIELLFHTLNNKAGDSASYHEWVRSLAEVFAASPIRENSYAQKEFERPILSMDEGYAAFYASCTIRSDNNGGSAAGIAFRDRLLHPIGEKVQDLRQNSDYGCELNLKSERNERALLQAIDQNFLRWFMDDYVSKNPEKWVSHSRSITNLHGDVQENTREIAKALDCLHTQAWPAGYVPIAADYTSGTETIKFWEEQKPARVFEQADERTVPSPYLRILLQPPKEALKKSIREGISNIAERDMNSLAAIDENTRNQIREATRGKQITQLISYGDGDETFASLLIKIRDGEITMRPATQADLESNPDITVDIDIDFIYGIMGVVKRPTTIYPDWERPPPPTSTIDRIKLAKDLVPVILDAMTSGKLRVRPITALPATIANAAQTANMIARFA